jgi:hypothetical protein
MIEIIFILFGFFVIPTIGSYLSKSIETSWRQKGILFIVFISILIINILLYSFNFFYDYNILYYIIALLIYLMYCFIINSIKKLDDHDSNSIYSLGKVPIIIFYIIGIVLLPMIGFLSWGINENYKIVNLKDNHTFSIQYSGNVMTEWITLSVNKKYLVLPLIHKEILSTSVRGEEGFNKDDIKIDFNIEQNRYKIKLYDNKKIITDTILEK